MTLRYMYMNYLSGANWYSRTSVSPQVKKFAKYLTKDMTVLEIGCGSGVDSDYLKSLKVNTRTCDIKGTVADDICVCEELPYGSNSFDAVFCRGVLHLTDYKLALFEIDRIIKSDGLCYISYPQDVYAVDEYYQLIPASAVRPYFAKILYTRRSKKNHGEHDHTFVQYLGRWR